MSEHDATPMREVARGLDALAQPVERHHVNVVGASAEALVHLPPEEVPDFAARSAAVAQQLERLRATLDATSRALSEYLDAADRSAACADAPEAPSAPQGASPHVRPVSIGDHELSAGGTTPAGHDAVDGAAPAAADPTNARGAACAEADVFERRYLDVVRQHLEQWSQNQSAEPLERRLDERHHASGGANREVRADTVELNVPRARRRKKRRPLPEWLGD